METDDRGLLITAIVIVLVIAIVTIINTFGKMRTERVQVINGLYGKENTSSLFKIDRRNLLDKKESKCYNDVKV